MRLDSLKMVNEETKLLWYISHLLLQPPLDFNCHIDKKNGRTNTDIINCIKLNEKGGLQLQCSHPSKFCIKLGT